MRFSPVILLAALLLLLCLPVTALGGDEGWIEVRCNVDGAAVYFDSSYKGQISGGSLTVPVYSTGAPVEKVRVEKDGYTTFSEKPNMPGNGQTTVVYATLNPITTPTPTQYGSLYIESAPSGASIYFNNNYRGISPVTINDIWPGSYTISAEMPGYRTYTTTAYVSSGTRSTVYCSLTKLDTTGALYIISTPSNANIYVDGAYKGQTPATVGNLASGTHIVEVDHAGYYDWKSTVDVPAGGTRTISATLNPMPSSTVGWIYVSSSPGGAAVTLDGASVGQTPYSGSLKLNNIATGEHTITLSLAGYSPYSARTSVSPNTVSEVSAILQPISAPAKGTGGISVSSTPSGAQVFLDNAFVGITPLTLHAVTAGTHTVTIRMDGYQDFTTTTPVNADAVSTVSAALMKITPTPKSPVTVLPVIAGLLGALVLISRRIR